MTTSNGLLLDNSGSDTTPFTIKTNGSAGNYTPTNSGIFIKDAAGGEIFRIFGSDPDYANDYNSFNLYIGYIAGASNPTDNVTAGFGNTGIGAKSLTSILTGNENSAFGLLSLRDATTASANSAFGSWALYRNTTGGKNTALGSFALGSNLTGSENTSVGYSSQWGMTGSKNTSLGVYTGGGSGSNNIFLGYQAGSNDLATGSNNIILGYDISLPVESGSNQLNIGNLIFGTGINGTGTTPSSGNIGIGTSGPTAKLDINSNGIRIRTSNTPASASAACNQGDIAWDASFTYVCVATNTWKRSALTTW